MWHFHKNLPWAILDLFDFQTWFERKHLNFTCTTIVYESSAFIAAFMDPLNLGIDEVFEVSAYHGHTPPWPQNDICSRALLLGSRIWKRSQTLKSIFVWHGTDLLSLAPRTVQVLCAYRDKSRGPKLLGHCHSFWDFFLFRKWNIFSHALSFQWIIKRY